MKTRVKNAHEAVAAGDDNADEQVRIAQKRIDKAGAKGVIHKNAAARRTSRLMKQAAKHRGLTSSRGSAAQCRQARHEYLHYRSLVEPARAA